MDSLAPDLSRGFLNECFFSGCCRLKGEDFLKFFVNQSFFPMVLRCALFWLPILKSAAFL